MNNERKYSVIYEPAEEGGWIAHVPTLNDLTTQGETLEEAKIMVLDAIQGYLAVLEEMKLPIPVENSTNKPLMEQMKIAV